MAAIGEEQRIGDDLATSWRKSHFFALGTGCGARVFSTVSTLLSLMIS
jgi:hypothetical protein